MPTTAGYYRQPTLHRDKVVFVCEDDLWECAASGGIARRLTTSSGAAMFPRFSRDGRWIAFTGHDEGPTEVYVIEADGGAPQRLTHLGSTVRTVGWSPEETIVFQTNYGRPFAGDLHLHEVSPAGGPSARIPWGPVREVSFEPGGDGVVIGINSGDPARWKRYRGGTAGTLWIDRDGDEEFEPLLDLPGNVASPMWIGSRIWFLSDHEGHGNLYSCTRSGRGLRRHTDHEDYYVRFPSTDGRRIVYHAGADLYVHDPNTDRSKRIDVRLHSPRSQRSRKFVPAAKHLEGADLHPAGHTLACSVRGGAYVFAPWEGAPLRHGEISSARYRLLRWLPDGERVVWVTDDRGEESLVVARADGSGRHRRLRRRLGRITGVCAAPAGDRLAVTNHRNELWVVELKGGHAKRVARSEWLRIHGMSWSSDGRWLAYDQPVGRGTSTIWLYDAPRGRAHEVTRPGFGDVFPSFDPDGKYLYFLSRRVWDPVYDQQYFDLGFPKAVVPCALPLAKDTPSPFAAEHRPPRAPRPAPPPDGRNRKAAPKTVVDLPGIAGRVVRFPVPEARYTGIQGGRGRVFFSSVPVEGSLGTSWAETGAPPAKARLEYWDLDAAKAETLLSGITDFSLSMDAKTLLVRAGNRLRVLPAMLKPKMVTREPKPGRETGWVDLGRLRVAVEPAREWRQMFAEAWRLQRDQFWSEDLAQVDWQGVYDRYLPLVDRVTTRSEFSDLLWEAQGELGTSHCYELGGDYRPSPRWHQGFLGADIEWSARRNAWRIERILRGDSWDAPATSPLDAPGVLAREGDEILAVDGRSVDAGASPFAALGNQAGRPVVLELRSRGRRRRVVVKCLGDERPLRYRDMVERNREYVHEATGGKVGYVHIPDMGPRGFSEFHRYYRQEVDHDGLIIDVRWNGGGHVSQLLLEKLLRRRIGYDRPRWHGVESYPDDAPMGPMVAITNEYAGSDGDMFSHAFKLYGLGPLIGKRTWGGVVGIWPRHALVDGTITTQPEFASWFEDVGYGVENYGTDPDVEVQIPPQDHARELDTQLERALDEVERRIEELGRSVPELPAAPKLTPPRLKRRKR